MTLMNEAITRQPTIQHLIWDSGHAWASSLGNLQEIITVLQCNLDLYEMYELYQLPAQESGKLNRGVHVVLIDLRLPGTEHILVLWRVYSYVSLRS